MKCHGRIQGGGSRGWNPPKKGKKERKKIWLKNKFGIVESKLVVIYLNECTLLSPPQSSTNFESPLDKKLDTALNVYSSRWQNVYKGRLWDMYSSRWRVVYKADFALVWSFWSMYIKVGHVYVKKLWWIVREKVGHKMCTRSFCHCIGSLHLCLLKEPVSLRAGLSWTCTDPVSTCRQ